MNASRIVHSAVGSTLSGVHREVVNRAYRASNELRNAALHVLRGKRSGRLYRVPFTRQWYTASAPGEPPAVRTGVFRLSWKTHTRVEKSGLRYRAVSSIESGVTAGGHLLGDMLEYGTVRMAPRPYKQAVRARALPSIIALYKKSL